MLNVALGGNHPSLWQHKQAKYVCINIQASYADQCGDSQKKLQVCKTILLEKFYYRMNFFIVLTYLSLLPICIEMGNVKEFILLYGGAVPIQTKL